MAVPDVVQHVSGSSALAQAQTDNGEYRLRLPNGTQAGNCLIVSFQGGVGVDPSATVSDDKSNTWAAGPANYDTTNQQKLWTFYALNVAADTRLIKIKNTTGQPILYVWAAATEFYNVATSSAADGSNSNSATSGTTITAGSITPSTTGGLIYQVAIRDNPLVMASGNWGAGSQANITWKLLSADRHDGTAMQWGQYTSTSAINPTMSQGDTSAWISCALVLKTATAGAARPAGIRVVAIHHFSQPSSGTAMPGAVGISNPETVQVPTIGNLLIATYSVGSTSFVLTSITDSGGYGWDESGGGVSNGTQDTCKIYYSANRTASPTNVLTCNYNGVATNDATLMVFDVAGAAAVQNDLERTGSATGDQTTNSATLTTCTVTPSTPNGLVIFMMQNEFNTENGISSPSGALFDAFEFDGMNQDGPENCDQNGGWAHYYNTNLNALTAVWTLISATNPSRQWAAYGAAFKGVTDPTMGYLKPVRVRPASFKPGLAR